MELMVDEVDDKRPEKNFTALMMKSITFIS